MRNGINLASTYLNLGLRGDDQINRLRSAIDILRRLKAAGKLNPQQEALLEQLEALLGKPASP